MFASFVSLLVLAEALLAQPAGPQAEASSEKSVWQDVHPIISKYKGVFGKPPGSVPADKVSNQTTERSNLIPQNQPFNHPLNQIGTIEFPLDLSVSNRNN
jgi:hypothetical protein